MTDRDPHPGPARPTAPPGGHPAEGGDPPTVRSAPGVVPGAGGPIGPVPASSLRGTSSRSQPNPPPKADAPPLPVPGDRIDCFGLEEAIGAGGMGAVFRAVDIKLDRMVALKILPPDQAVDPEVVQRYYQEGRAAARLDHENIARVFSIGHDGRYHYIAFEYIEGTTIRQRVEADGPLPVGDAINFTLQIAGALVHASGRGVVHRDIKPSNIIVTPQGRAKLVDMGLARRFERGEDTGLTQSGMTLGTFDYISPEQARDPRDVDVRGDLYSLGCTLFHMLSGRPPFPEGTVLQKLLQHQEEPPPDIRSLNPGVPDELAAILVKLMAKDRDRRYQTPEQLVRDLLTLAGSLGLRSINPEGLVWMAPTPAAPGWARHLVWGVPATAFLVVLAAQAWWGEGPSPLVAPAPQSSPGTVADPARPSRTSPRTAAKSASPIAASGPPSADLEPPRTISVASTDALIRELNELPARSTILLSGPGPYDLRKAGAAPWNGLDVAIKAEAGVRPLIRLPRGAGGAGEPAPSALLDLAGGRVTLDGLEFEVGEPGVTSAIRAEDAELTVRRCSFRRPGGSDAPDRSAAIAIRGSARALSARPADRAASLLVEASEFDGGQAGVLVAGPVEVGLRDCTFGPPPAGSATVWGENPEPNAGPADFRVAHVSVLAGPGPVFRFSGVAPRVRVSESAFAPPSPTAPASALVAIDSADRLDWRGVDNLYGRFSSFLQPARGSTLRPAIRTFEAWADDPASPWRESGSAPIDQPWEEPDPLGALAATSGLPGPTRAFRLAVPPQGPQRPGARQGPEGPLPTPVIATTAPASNPGPIPDPTAVAGLPTVPIVSPARPREVASAAGVGTATTTATGARPRPSLAEDEPDVRSMPFAPAPSTAPKPNGAGREVDPEPAGELTPMPMPTTITAEVDRSTAPTAAANGPGPGSAPPPSPRPEAPTPAPIVAQAPEPAPIRKAEQFLEALGKPGPGVRTLVIAPDADWNLPAIKIRSLSSWVIRAERGPSRPKIRFRPESGANAGPSPNPAASTESWQAWITVQSGGVRFEGLDLIMPVPPPTAAGPAGGARRRAAFAVAPGTTDLALVDCSVTVEGDDVPSSLIAVLAGEPGGEARVRVEDSLLRSGGDAVDVGPGRRLDLDVDNAVIATGGALVHGHGIALGHAPEPIKLVLRRATARMVGGLAQIRASEGEPDLPTIEIVAHDSIFTTNNPDTPLIRVDGRRDLDELQGLVRWEGRSVAYHQINTYRRDESTLPGVMPVMFNRESWGVSGGRREEFAIHNDVKFVDEWDRARAIWTLRPEDVRLRPESPAANSGADLSRIPPADPPI